MSLNSEILVDAVYSILCVVVACSGVYFSTKKALSRWALLLFVAYILLGVALVIFNPGSAATVTATSIILVALYCTVIRRNLNSLR